MLNEGRLKNKKGIYEGRESGVNMEKKDRI
jgi:hypothetical protein